MPTLNPNDFVAKIDSPLLTMRPGTRFVFEVRDSGEVTTVFVTHETKVIDGVTCIVVHDTARINGLVEEDTFDYFAQDTKGNVWYFGEDTKSFEPGDPKPVSTEGSWRAGVHGAGPGIVMLAHPHTGDKYNQENAPGIAEDRAEVVGTDIDVNIAYGSFGGAVGTKEVNPLDPSVEHKYYVPGVGEVLTVDADGTREEGVAITVTGTGRGEALIGYAGGDRLSGRGGGDMLSGGAGSDTINGGRGNDRLSGGSGHDRLVDGAGSDRLTGGDDADAFVFAGLHDGQRDAATITDYRREDVDVIDLGNGNHSIASEHKLAGGWQLTLKGDGDTIFLAGVTDRNHDGHIGDDLLIV